MVFLKMSKKYGLMRERKLYLRYKYNEELLYSSISVFTLPQPLGRGFFSKKGGDSIMDKIIIKSLEEVATVLAVMFVKSLFEENTR